MSCKMFNFYSDYKTHNTPDSHQTFFIYYCYSKNQSFTAIYIISISESNYLVVNLINNNNK